MINLTLRLGNQTIAGFTFSVTETVVDEIISTISAITSNTQIANTYFRNGSQQANNYTDLTVDLATALTLSVILQADSVEDVDFYNGIGVNLKQVSVDLIT